MRADLGMIFQEGALFDSLTVRENVGYKLYEETEHAARGGRPARRRGPRLHRPRSSTSTRCRRSCRAGSAAASPSRGRWPSSRSILLYDEATTGLDPITATTVDDEIIKLRDLEEVSSIVVTHQLRDAFYVATHMAVARLRTGRWRSSRRRPKKSAKRSSSCSRTAWSASRATPRRCASSKDPYIRTFLS